MGRDTGVRQLTPPVLNIQQRVDGLIHDAENAKARMHEVQGRNNTFEQFPAANALDLNN